MSTHLKMIHNKLSEELIYTAMNDRMASNYISAQTMWKLEGKGPEIAIPGDNPWDPPRDHHVLATKTGEILGYFWERSNKIYWNKGLDITNGVELYSKAGGNVVLTVETNRKFSMVNFVG